jgi:hypothetical protein
MSRRRGHPLRLDRRYHLPQDPCGASAQDRRIAIMFEFWRIQMAMAVGQHAWI